MHAWPVQRIVADRRFRSLLPLYPLYFATLDLRSARLVVSSSSAFAKSVRTAPDALHVAYIHTPMRQAWALDDYLRGSSYPLPARLAARLIRAPLQALDRLTARRPDVLVANSETVRGRIRDTWRREATVINPPVNLAEFRLTGQDDGFLLIAARLVAHRRVDVAIEAANRSRRELVVVGDGPERGRLARMAGPTVRLVGRLERAPLIDLFQRCHAYIAPAEEDFGIAAVEAMACGKPVVGLARGGVAETVVDGLTGVHYDDASARGLAGGLEHLDALEWDAPAIREQAARYDRSRFISAWRALLADLGVDPALYDSGT